TAPPQNDPSPPQPEPPTSPGNGNQPTDGGTGTVTVPPPSSPSPIPPTTSGGNVTLTLPPPVAPPPLPPQPPRQPPCIICIIQPTPPPTVGGGNTCNQPSNGTCPADGRPGSGKAIQPSTPSHGRSSVKTIKPVAGLTTIEFEPRSQRSSDAF